MLLGHREVGWIVFEDGAQRVRGGITCEGPPTAEHFVQHRAERKNVGPVIDGASPGLLGRHVADGSQNDAIGGLSWRGREHAHTTRRVALDEFGETEIQNLRQAVGGDEQVLGLEIAMEDAPRVSGRKAAGDLHANLDRLASRAARRSGAAHAA